MQVSLMSAFDRMWSTASKILARPSFDRSSVLSLIPFVLSSSLSIHGLIGNTDSH
jgi:hypothetical protein